MLLAAGQGSCRADDALGLGWPCLCSRPLLEAQTQLRHRPTSPSSVRGSGPPWGEGTGLGSMDPSLHLLPSHCSPWLEGLATATIHHSALFLGGDNPAVKILSVCRSLPREAVLAPSQADEQGQSAGRRGRVEGEGGHVVVTCSRHLAEGPRAAWGLASLLRSCVDCHFKSGREGTRVQPPRAEGSGVRHSVLFLPCPQLEPACGSATYQLVALGKLLSLSDTGFPHL